MLFALRWSVIRLRNSGALSPSTRIEYRNSDVPLLNSGWRISLFLIAERYFIERSARLLMVSSSDEKASMLAHSS